MTGQGPCKDRLAICETLKEMNMNKEQFEAKKAIIDKHRGHLDALMADIEKEYAKSQRAEAEKPELRHGDYGIWCFQGGDPVFAIYIDHLMTKDTMFYDGKLSAPYASKELARGADEDGKSTTFVKLGNIFDDLKALSEPLLSFQADVHTYSFDWLNLPQTPIQVAGNWHTEKEAEEISMKIQRVIYTAKQSKAKNDTDN